MTTALRAELATGRWQELSLLEQLANIGSEVGRATRAKSIGNEDRLAGALDRCLELFDLTLADGRWRGRRREIARAREIVCDFLVGDNTYASTAGSLDAYFLPFAVAARRVGRDVRPTMEAMEVSPTDALVTRSEDAAWGAAVIAGTRVPVETLFAYLESGKTLDEFLEQFPTVSHEKAVAILQLANQGIVAPAVGPASDEP